MIGSSIIEKPTIFVGQYVEVVELLLSGKYDILLRPKVVWIEYRTIPILDIVKWLRNKPYFADQFFFLEIPYIEILDKLLESTELFSMVHHGFFTIIINIPNSFSFSNDFVIRLRELVREVNVILIMENLVFPQTQINLVKVESNH